MIKAPESIAAGEAARTRVPAALRFTALTCQQGSVGLTLIVFVP